MRLNLTLTLSISCLSLLLAGQTPFNGISVQEVPIDPSINIATQIESTMPIVDGNGTPDNNARCWRLYVCMDEQLWECYYYWGDNLFPWTLSSTTSFYQSAINGGFLANETDPSLFPAEPASEYDSWFTIGYTYNSSTWLFLPGGADPSTTWEYGSPLQNSFSITDIAGSNVIGTWSAGNSEGLPDADNKVLIAQFTTDGIWSATMNFVFRELLPNYTPSGNSQVVFGINIDGTPGAEPDICPLMFLPIELMSFSAEPRNSAVYLNWSTSSEINNDFFTVERSLDRNQWEEVSKMPGAGTSNLTNHYASVDPNPYPGISYYRLKQTDTNGEFSYSFVASVDIRENDYTIYPNPSTDQIAIRGSIENIAYISILNASGGLVTQLDRRSNSGSVSLIEHHLNPGLYLVEIESLNGEVQFKKLIVKH